jgi:hypothetical protein
MAFFYGEAGFYQWEFSASLESYEEAAAPAKVGKRLIESLFRTELPQSRTVWPTTPSTG